MDLLEEHFDEGMQADVAAHVLLFTAVDLRRANYGDAQVAEALKRAIDRRVEKPTKHWGWQASLTYHRTMFHPSAHIIRISSPIDRLSWHQIRNRFCRARRNCAAAIEPATGSSRDERVLRVIRRWLALHEAIGRTSP